jgi:hypothetical protein
LARSGAARRKRHAAVRLFLGFWHGPASHPRAPHTNARFAPHSLAIPAPGSRSSASRRDQRIKRASFYPLARPTSPPYPAPQQPWPSPEPPAVARSTGVRSAADLCRCVRCTSRLSLFPACFSSPDHIEGPVHLCSGCTPGKWTLPTPFWRPYRVQVGLA